MTINWWGLGLQAVNALVLVWLLSRVFWGPVAGAIARRQAAAQAMLDAGAAAQAKADAALAEVANTRAGLAAERDSVLADASAAAEVATKAAMTEAQVKADALMAAAQTAIDRDKAAARKEAEKNASALSVEIAARLLARFNTPPVRTAFLAHLVEAIKAMPVADRTALVTPTADLDIVTATTPEDADKAGIEQAITDALGGAPMLHFVTDADLIAGMELRSAHFVLHNSWRADLDSVLKEVRNAA